MCGVITGEYPALTCARRKKFSKRSRNNVPLGNHKGRPMPTFSEKANNSISLPSLRWSRRLASSNKVKYSSNSFALGKVIA